MLLLAVLLPVVLILLALEVLLVLVLGVLTVVLELVVLNQGLERPVPALLVVWVVALPPKPDFQLLVMEGPSLCQHHALDRQ